MQYKISQQIYHLEILTSFETLITWQTWYKTHTDSADSVVAANKTWQTLYKTHTDSADSVVAAKTKHDKLYTKPIQTVLTQWLQQKKNHDKLYIKPIQTVLTQWLQQKITSSRTYIDPQSNTYYKLLSKTYKTL